MRQHSCCCTAGRPLPISISSPATTPSASISGSSHPTNAGTGVASARTSPSPSPHVPTMRPLLPTTSESPHSFPWATRWAEPWRSCCGSGMSRAFAHSSSRRLRATSRRPVKSASRSSDCTDSAHSRASLRQARASASPNAFICSERSATGNRGPPRSCNSTTGERSSRRVAHSVPSTHATGSARSRCPRVSS